MQSNKFDKWLSIFTNISVLLGIFLLIFELNQNNELVRVQIEQTRSDTYVAWQREVASGEHVAPLWVKINEATEGDFTKFKPNMLDPVELERFSAIAQARFYDYETLYAQFQRGFVSDEYWHERIVPVIQNWDIVWNRIYTEDPLTGRKSFEDERERIRKLPE